MEYVESTNVISMNNALPTTDSTGKSRLNDGEYFDFTVKSSITGNTDINYEIAAKEENGNTFDGKNIKFYLTKVNSDGSEEEAMPPKTYSEDPSGNGYTGRPSDMMSLFVGNLNQQGDTEIKYRLRLWVDESYNPQNDNGGLVYKVKVNVYGQTSDTVAQVEDTYCKDNGFTTLSDCMLVMNNHETSVETAKTNISSKGTPDFSKTATTDEGLFTAEDDDGSSYYYRGAVKNNYVLFAGFMWRIIRQNGDGSVRMIYSGKKTNASDEEKMIGSSAFNKKYWDPTYVGYKYGENFQLLDNNHSLVLNGNTYNAARKYLFASNYNFDTKTKKFVLAGDSKQLIWKDNYQEIIDSFPYSCLSLDCDILFKLREYKDEQTLIAEPISYSSSSYTETLNNEFDSTIKKSIDSWYATNLINYTSYLADSTFCNDRSIYIGTGYRVFENTLYKTYDTFKGKLSPTLNCSNISDSFKVSNDLAKLNYPVALITVNEAIMAGMINNSSSQNYLYTTAPYWTMTASDYDAGNFFAHNAWIMGGKIEISVRVVETGGIRPVININKDVNILKGDGTSISPYILTE